MEHKAPTVAERGESARNRGNSGQPIAALGKVRKQKGQQWRNGAGKPQQGAQWEGGKGSKRGQQVARNDRKWRGQEGQQVAVRWEGLPRKEGGREGRVKLQTVGVATLSGITCICSFSTTCQAKGGRGEGCPLATVAPVAPCRPCCPCQPVAPVRRWEPVRPAGTGGKGQRLPLVVWGCLGLSGNDYPPLAVLNRRGMRLQTPAYKMTLFVP